MKAIIVLCALLAGIPAEAQQIYRSVDGNGRVQYTDKPPAGVKASGATRPEIKMYSTDWCGYCQKARDYMARNRIRYTELDVEKSAAAKAEYQRLGGRGVPVILVGAQRMNGYSEERFVQMLKAAGY